MIPSRYLRQIQFSAIGPHGQERLKEKHVLVVGAGALGTSIADMLVRGGVGTIRLVDGDYVDFTNLQRQCLFDELDAESMKPKAQAAYEKLKRINSEVTISAFSEEITPRNIDRIGKNIDLIIDATDSLETRRLINDYAYQTGTPWIFGACAGSYGLTFNFIPGQTPCFRCLEDVFGIADEHVVEGERDEEDTCDSIGVIAPAVHIVTSYQVTESLKWLTGNRESLRQTLLAFDCWNNEISQVQVASLFQPNCPTCGPSPTYPALFSTQSNGVKISILCGRETIQIRSLLSEGWVQKIDWDSFLVEVNGQWHLQNRQLRVFDWRNCRVIVFLDGRILIHGTKDIQLAQDLVSHIEKEYEKAAS